MKFFSFLLLCLFPFDAFCRSFTSDNLIVLPTTSHDNLVLPAVLDRDGDPVTIGRTYIIDNPFIGGGSVYLENIGNLKCPNGVLHHMPIPSFMGDGTPVEFVLKADDDDVVREMYATNIKFFVKTSRLCVNETVWKVDDKKFVVTGGTIGNENDFFKMMKVDSMIPEFKHIYKLMHCPSQLGCKDIGGSVRSGYPSLAVVEEQYIPFVFFKAKN